MVMTVLDMLDEIAVKIKKLDAAEPGVEREMAVEDAQLIAGLAKNFFIGANIAVEKERLQAKYKVLSSSILDELIGGKDYIKMLKERDKPMPMKQYFWQSERFKNDPPADICGKCGRVLGETAVFCSECGQRVDRENYQL